MGPWVLLIISLLTGHDLIREGPFAREEACELRANTWRGILDADHYKVLCLLKDPAHPPRPAPDPPTTCGEQDRSCTT
jgi:hypothetical protein